MPTKQRYRDPAKTGDQKSSAGRRKIKEDAGLIIPEEEGSIEVIVKRLEEEKHFTVKTNNEETAIAGEGPATSMAFLDEIATGVVVPTFYQMLHEKLNVRYPGVIRRADWAPKSVVDHEPEFALWIRAMLSQGFDVVDTYEKFDLYRKQALSWYCDAGTPPDVRDVVAHRNYWIQESSRISENSLYFMNRWLKLRKGNLVEGGDYYSSWLSHEIVAYLWDCNYSTLIGKGRQAALTSTITGLSLPKLITIPNLFIKFISVDEDKTKEIFNDKLKWQFGQLPTPLRPRVLNDQSGLLSFGHKDEKGVISGLNSRFQCDVPKIDSINGGTPNKVLVDELSLIPFLTEMFNEGRPTMFTYNPQLQKLAQQQQVFGWGSGAAEKANAGGLLAFQREWQATKTQFLAGNFDHGIIPLMLNWRARPGIDKIFWEKERKYYYAKAETGGSASKKQFHQHYPENDSDMFLGGDETLVPFEIIQLNLDKIAKVRPQYGYLVPIVDEGSPVVGKEDDVGFAIKGANFIPCEPGDPMITTTIAVPFRPGYKNRWYQGTDAIGQSDPMSLMGSAVWDKKYKTFAGAVHTKDPDHLYCFLQTLLLGMYYSGPVSGKDYELIPELVERKYGQTYIDYKKDKGFGASLVYNMRLPPSMRSRTKVTIGFENSGTAQRRALIEQLHEVMTAHAHGNYIEEMWEEMKTFTSHPLGTGETKWASKDKRYYHDDLLFGGALAYVCGERAFATYEMEEPKEEGEINKVFTYRLHRAADGTLTRVLAPQVVKQTRRAS